jgi:hypothetical protein
MGSYVLICLALGWGLVSFWLHCILHEFSHVLVARQFGGRLKSFKLYPHRAVSGRLVWASVELEFQTLPTLIEQAQIAVAPFVVEAVWFALAILVEVLLPSPWWVIAAVESTSAAVEMLVWYLGGVRGTKGTDGELFSQVFPSLFWK